MRRTSLCSLLLLGLVCGERISTPLHAAEGFPATIHAPARNSTSENPIKELKRLALSGDAEAQNNLGLYYLVGLGVPRDYVEGVRWYRLAADQGNAAAQRSLGFSYAEG